MNTREDFLRAQRQKEAALFEQGYAFVGNLMPRKIGGDVDEQKTAILAEAGVAELQVIGDVMSVYDGDPTVRELIFLGGYCATYGLRQVID